MERRLSPVQKEQIEAASGGVPLRELVAGILDRLDPDAERPLIEGLAFRGPSALPVVFDQR